MKGRTVQCLYVERTKGKVVLIVHDVLINNIEPGVRKEVSRLFAAVVPFWGGVKALKPFLGTKDIEPGAGCSKRDQPNPAFSPNFPVSLLCEVNSPSKRPSFYVWSWRKGSGLSSFELLPQWRVLLALWLAWSGVEQPEPGLVLDWGGIGSLNCSHV